jgi:asparagine synthase (glutamine-hydrolysing)
MCGICGAIPAARDTVEAMKRRMAHRGPDGHGTHEAGPEGPTLGHLRLAIIDVATGQQPMGDAEGELWVTFNGEIYNHRELRAELEREGRRFATASDTEVLLHLYRRDGDAFLHRLEGMFAFALWDGRAGRLLLARDRLGIKPLYTLEHGGRLYFASEIKAFHAVPGFTFQVSEAGLGSFLANRFTTGPQTLVQGVRRLLPGHLMVWQGGRSQTRCWWDLPAPAAHPVTDLDAAARELHALMEDSVRSKLMSEVPLGVFLSGGLDSSYVAALAAPHAGGRLRTFSVGFGDGRANELPFARAVSEHLATDHREVLVGDRDVALFADIAWHMDEPLGDAAILPTYVISRHTKPHATVALAGEGADELFAGYERYRAGLAAERLGTLATPVGRAAARGVAHAFPLSSNLRRGLEVAGARAEERYGYLVALWTEPEWRRLGGPGRMPDHLPRRVRGLDAMLRADQRTVLPDDFLMKADKMTMAFGIEERVPFLDHRVADLAARLHPRLKRRGREGKLVVKRAALSVLPREIVHRRKHGYNAPMDAWFRGALKAPLERLWEERQHAHYDVAPGRRLLAAFQRQGGSYAQAFPNAQKLFSLLMFELWHREHVLGEAPAAVRARFL